MRPWIALAGIKIINFSMLNNEAMIIRTPAHIASICGDMLLFTAAAISGRSDTVGPTMLKLLLPTKAAVKPAQQAVIMPKDGGIPAATARVTAMGIDKNATDMPDCQLDIIFLSKLILYALIVIISILG